MSDSYRGIAVGIASLLLPSLLGSCKESMSNKTIELVSYDNSLLQQAPIDTGEQVVTYASTLLGTPYKIAGKDEEGFDCSGFVSYVFKKYDIDIPSSTRYMIRVGKEISLDDAAPGDIILFTGTDTTSREVGHAGIVVSQLGEAIKFIHSSSAKSSACVKYNTLGSGNYKRRFIMVRRVLNQ